MTGFDRRAAAGAPAPNAGRARGCGERLRELRQERGRSQLELALQVGVSQRHLSCLETGRARPSRGMLAALLEALDAPLETRNEVQLAAGFAPLHGQRAWDAPELAPVRAAIDQLLRAHEPSPAFVLDGAWNVLQVNQGVHRLAQRLGLPESVLAPPLNMLLASFAPGGLSRLYENRDEVQSTLWRRACREAAHVPALAALVAELREHVPEALAPGRAPRRHDAGTAARVGSRQSPAPALDPGLPPMLLAHLAAPDGGRLSFFSTFTTVGSPLDVTVASLRIEHLFPADEGTRRALLAD